MANPDNIFPLVSQPGIQRDGTTFDSPHYIDGQWCRWYRTKPQKMGGYNKMNNGFTSTRQLNGVPAASPEPPPTPPATLPVAANAFDGNPLTTCKENIINGYISYSWGTVNYAITSVGIISFATLTYALVAEYSTDGITWINSLTIPSQSYTAGTLYSFNVPVPVLASNFRVRETGGAMLNIAELYFNISGPYPINIPRGLFVIPSTPLFNIYVGDFQSLKYFPADNTTGLAVGNPVDRTPVLFNANQYNQWIFDVMFSTSDNSSILIAMATQNLYAIDQTVESPIYYGDANATTPLIETGIYTSGGFCVLHPFLFHFGNDGHIGWSKANDPKTIMNEARVTATKILAGLPVRGGNSSPAGLFWSLDSVIRGTMVGTNTDIQFAFDTVTGESSLLSSSSIVEYDGIYYWAGVDRFLCYTGVVQELPNSMSLQYFFNNLNYSQRQKVWATKITQYGEIWWFYPSGSNTECDKAVIYSVREQVWYDTNISRGCGYFDQIFTKPIWASNTISGGDYNVWRHEVGLDSVDNDIHSAIQSNFEMSVISWVANGPGGQNTATDKVLYAYRFEPDFVQSGDMTLIVNGRQYANSVVEESAPYIFNKDPSSPDFAEKVDLREQRRLMTLRFDSNEVGGYYQMGKCLLVPRMGDTRP